MNKIDKQLLAQIAGIHSMPEGSYNIRKNGESIGRKSDSDIEIVSKKDKSGIDIIVKPNVVGKSVHIPVIITVGGLSDLVYNDFYIGENADVTIVAGCGIHNDEKQKSEHNGIHSFHIARGAKVKYLERHLATGKGKEKVLNPITNIVLEENAQMTMETYQLGGVSYSIRKTKAKLKKGAKLVIQEKILTENEQVAKTKFDVTLLETGSSVEVVSRSVAKGNSNQEFISNIIGKAECFGHVECDGIAMDNSRIISIPKIDAACPDASLVHEAAIGKIAGDQLIKLTTLGLTTEQAEQVIIEGFLK